VVEDRPMDGAAEFQELPITNYTPGDITLQCTTAKPGVAVLSQAWHPDWKITDNGHPLGLRRVNYGFMGFALPAGEHSLRIWYRPWDFYWGGLISAPLWAITLITGACWLVCRKHPRTA